MNIKKKGKVHPSPPPPLPSFASSKAEQYCLSVLKLLPAVILLLVSSLSPEDKQVLAYLITRSTTTTTTTTSGRRRSSCSSRKNKKAPRFDCECFDCYTSYWCRWDSSPNRDLIHQIIEAYEDHLTTESEKPKGGRGGRKKKKARGRRAVEHSGRPEEPTVASKTKEHVVVPSGEAKPEESTFQVATTRQQHKGLARKVLPDVMGLFNWRFWRLWNPNA